MKDLLAEEVALLARAALACAPTSTSACAGGQCMPVADEPACIFREGEHACPTDWPVRELWYRGHMDDRACDCSCGDPSGTDCDGEVLLFDGLDCDGEPVASVPLDDCEGVSANNFFYVPNAFGTCTPNTEIVGEVVPTGPVTLCCEN